MHLVPQTYLRAPGGCSSCMLLLWCSSCTLLLCCSSHTLLLDLHHTCCMRGGLEPHSLPPSVAQGTPPQLLSRHDENTQLAPLVPVQATPSCHTMSGPRIVTCRGLCRCGMHAAQHLFCITRFEDHEGPGPHFQTGLFDVATSTTRPTTVPSVD